MHVFVRLRRTKAKSAGLSLYHRCLSVLLAYMMLIGPFSLQQLAKGSSLYDQLETFNWSEGNRTIEYTYDENGSGVTKTTKATTTGAVIEKVEYTYNTANRLAKETVKDAGDVVLSWTEYTYNHAGIRVKSVHFDGSDTITPTYLVDSYNPTGYAQVLEELTQRQSTPNSATRIQYTIGDDVISQTKSDGVWNTDHWEWTASDTEYLLYDGHGSTRQLSQYDPTPGVEKAVVTECFSYDGYGVMLGGNPAPESPPASWYLWVVL